MNNQIFLVIAILFIVMILVDLIFNFTGILQENFDVFSNETYLEAVEDVQKHNGNNSNNGNNNNAPSKDFTHRYKINSVISHSFGTVYGTIPLGQRLPTTKVLFLVKKNVTLSIDEKAKILMKLPNSFDETQHLRLVKINNDNDIKNVITDGTYLATYESEYPFYFLQSVKNPEYFLPRYPNMKFPLKKEEIQKDNVLMYPMRNYYLL